MCVHNESPVYIFCKVKLKIFVLVELEMSRPSFSPAHQPYNIILAGSFGVGKSSLFNMLSGEVHADYQFSSVTGKQDASRSPSQHFGKWCHTALVNGDTVKVQV